MNCHLETIDLSSLSTVTGGRQQQQQQQQQPQQEDADERPQRTWGQVARDYGAACLQGAGQSVLFGGRPRNLREGLANAAAGCAMGVGMRAVDDLSGALTGGGR